MLLVVWTETRDERRKNRGRSRIESPGPGGFLPVCGGIKDDTIPVPYADDGDSIRV